MSELQQSYDFVVVGGGLAGLAAGVAAADAGLRVAVLEKSDTFGGVTAYSNGQLWVPASRQQLAASLEDSAESGAGYLRRLGMGFAHEEHIQAYVDLAPQVVRYFEDVIGARFDLIRGLPDYYYPDFEEAKPEGRYLEVAPLLGAELGEHVGLLRRSPHQQYRLTHEDMWQLGGGTRSHSWDRTLIDEREAQDALCMGTGIAAYFLRGAIQKGADLVAGVDVQELVVEGGRVRGVRVAGIEGVVHAERGVLLATGGYDWNLAEMRAFEGVVDIASAAPPSVTGDHLRLAGDIGAAITQTPKPVRLGYKMPGRVAEGEPLTGIFRFPSNPHAILVNRDGRRFSDESFYASIGHALKAIDGRAQQFVNWPCWMIFDTQFRSQYSIGSVTPETDLPAEWEWSAADTLAELAAQIGVDPEGLEAQVEEFNRGVEQGHDPVFHRGERPWSRRSYGDAAATGHPNLGTIEKGPFYAIKPELVGTGIPTVGLDTDPVGRVLSHAGKPIEGLYAAGNSSALLETGAGYQSGVANTRSLTVAYSSARAAAGL